MSFNASLPEWNKTATPPPQTKKDNGWEAEEHPPASWFNWFFNTTYLALQELQQEAAPLDTAQMYKLTQDNGELKTASSTDLNSFTTVGEWYISSTQTANKPSGLTYVFLELNKNGGEIYQRITQLGPTSNGQQWFRQYTGIGWTAWKQKVDLSSNGQLNVSNQSNISAIKTNTGNLSSGVDTKVINFTTTYRDTQSEFNQSAGEITIKENGLYLVEAQVIFSATITGNSYVKLYRNGVAWITITGGTSQAILYGQVQAQCVAGDVLSVYVVQSSGSTGTLNSFKLETIKIS
jgi:hypothetical protein